MPVADTNEPALGISLDLDDTLYRVRRIQVAWRLRHERGLLVALVAAREKLRHEAPFEDQARLEAREAELVAPAFGMAVSDAATALARLRAALPAALTEFAVPFSGVRSALEAAHVRGLKIAVLSDYDPVAKLVYLGLDDLPWSATLGAEQFGVLKPHPRAFHELAAAMSLDRRRIVHVGDREDLDVRGALGAGLRAWRFAPSPLRRTAAEAAFSRWRIRTFEPLWSGRVARSDQTY